MIEDEGVEQVTIRRIAETTNRTQPAIYQRFSSKDAILALPARSAEGATSLITIANPYVRFGMERPRLYEVMFATPPVYRFRRSHTPAPAQTALQIFATAVGESGLEPAQVDSVTEVVWAALHGLAMLSITKRLRPGRVLQRTRLETLTAAIAAITEST